MNQLREGAPPPTDCPELGAWDYPFPSDDEEYGLDEPEPAHSPPPTKTKPNSKQSNDTSKGDTTANENPYSVQFKSRPALNEWMAKRAPKDEPTSSANIPLTSSI